MTTIHKKIWPKLFNEVKSGRKKFEWRVADFKIKAGDSLVLEEWNPKTKKYTGKKIAKKVKYLAKFKVDEFGQKKLLERKGFYVIQF